MNLSRKRIKIAWVSSFRDWHFLQMEKEARLLGISFEPLKIHDTKSDKDVLLSKDVIIWRSGMIRGGVLRAVFFDTLKEVTFINRGKIRFPFLISKQFQQSRVRNHTKIATIPTFVFQNHAELASAIKNKNVNLPLIAKPDNGSKGEGIMLLKSLSDLKKIKTSLQSIDRYIFQEFIENDGDFRVIVIGGKAIGAIKRTAAEDSFLNNISQGGSAVTVSDPAVMGKLSKIASTIAVLFDLTFCGIDIIYDAARKQYVFMEVNTSPQWEGFQKTTGINVARELLLWCRAMNDRKKKKTVECVQKYYQDSFDLLRGDKFHFASRMFLWSKSKWSRVKLGELKEEFIGTTDEQAEKYVVSIVNDKYSTGEVLRADLRRKYFAKYPKLKMYNRLLFKSLFVESIYGKNWRPFIKKYINDSDFITLKKILEKDKQAVAALSTHAVNYFYLLDQYLHGFRTSSFVDVQNLLDISNEEYKKMGKRGIGLRIYLLTHCIIGESRFYQRIVGKNKAVYIKMLKGLEKIISENYAEVSLDNKFEFLVCAELCSYVSFLRPIILSEGETSLYQNGNYLVDTLNNNSGSAAAGTFVSSEHRNVLYLMAKTKFCQNK